MFKKAFNKKLFLLSSLAVFLSPSLALARDLDNLKVGDVVDILGNIRDWFAGIVAIVAVAMILWAAFLYMTSAGDDNKITQAKKTLVWAIIGIIVALAAYGIFAMIKSFLE